MPHLALDTKSKISQSWRGTAVWRMTLEKVRPQHLNAVGEQIFTTKQCSGQADLVSSGPLIFFFKSKAAFQDHLLKAECATAAQLRGKDKLSTWIRINTAAVSTNSNLTEHNLTVCLILGFCVFLSLSMSSELFQNIFSAVSATEDIFKNSFLLCHSATD